MRDAHSGSCFRAHDSGDFRDLQALLEGTENRIAVARACTINSVRDFNVTLRSFPFNLTAMAFGYQAKPIARAPKVAFGPAPAKPQGETGGVAK